MLNKKAGRIPFGDIVKLVASQLFIKLNFSTHYFIYYLLLAAHISSIKRACMNIP